MRAHTVIAHVEEAHVLAGVVQLIPGPLLGVPAGCRVDEACHIDDGDAAERPQLLPQHIVATLQRAQHTLHATRVRSSVLLSVQVDRKLKADPTWQISTRSAALTMLQTMLHRDAVSVLCDSVAA